MAATARTLARWTLLLFATALALALAGPTAAQAAHGGSVPTYGSGTDCTLINFEYDDGHTDHLAACGFGNDLTSADIPELHVTELHVSCSDVFPDGEFEKGDPTASDGSHTHTVDRYRIEVYKDYGTADQTLEKDCGEEFVPLSVDVCVDLVNDASGDGTYSDDETANAEGADAPERVTMTNCGEAPHVIDSITIDGEDVCPDQLGMTQQPGESVTCDLVQPNHTPAEGSIETDTVEVGVSHPDEPSRTATDSDPTAMTTVLGPPPPTPPVDVCIDLVNDASGDGTYSDNEVADAPGMDAPEQMTVTNCGDEPHVIDEVTIDGEDVCPDLLGMTLQPGESATCDHVQPEHTPAEGDLETDTAEVLVSHPDDPDTTANDSDPTAMTTLIPGLNVCVDLVNDASGDGTYSDDEVADAPGMDAPERVTMTNCGDQPQVIDEVTIGGEDVCPDLIGMELAPGDSVTCDLVQPDHTPAVNEIQTDEVSVLVHHPDDPDLTATDTDPTAMTTRGDTDVAAGGDVREPAPEPEPEPAPQVKAEELPATGARTDIGLSGLSSLTLGLLLLLGATPIVRQTRYARDDLRRAVRGS